MSRYLKRGVNEKGRVANDVETEQIVYEAVPGPSEVSSVVQNRGSIPLFWSQETSKLNLKPNIICKFQKLSMMQSVIFFNLESKCFPFYQCMRGTTIMKLPSFILKILEQDMETLLLS